MRRSPANAKPSHSEGGLEVGWEGHRAVAVHTQVGGMKKETSNKWDEDCEKAFGDVKSILMNPPVMSRPTRGEELQIYLEVSDSAVSVVLFQEKPNPKLVYFVSKTLQDTKR